MRAIDVYKGSDGEVTRAYYTELQKRGPVGMIAMNLFRAQKCSTRAKAYRGGLRGQGSYRGMAYERKEYSIQILCSKLAADDGELGIVYGWKRDEKTVLRGDVAWVLYVELPTGQVSFHSPIRFQGSDYAGEWDGQHASSERILAFCDAVMDRDPAEYSAAIRTKHAEPVRVDPSQPCVCVKRRGVTQFEQAKRHCQKCRGSGRVRHCSFCDGAVQAIINQQPPHSVYIEPFAGGAAVLRAKRPAQLQFAFDLDPAMAFWDDLYDDDKTLICPAGQGMCE